MLEHARNCWLCNMQRAGSEGDLAKFRTFWLLMLPCLLLRLLENPDQEGVGMKSTGSYSTVPLACP